MNIHPMFVHFPVALFLVYSLLEILRFKKLTSQPYWFYPKAVIVIIGAISAPITVITGIMAKLQFQAQGTLLQIINTHAALAITTTSVFGFIAIFHIIGWIRRSDQNSVQRFSAGTLRLESSITEGNFGLILAIIGGALISITGAFGGLIAYGPDNDPVSSFIYQTFFEQNKIRTR